MNELKKQTGLAGFFDVKLFNARVDRSLWKIKGEEDNITFRAVMGYEQAQERQLTGKEFTGKDGARMVAVTFKIGSRCRWFDELAQEIGKPANDTLDGVRYNVNVQYRELQPDPKNPMSPRGYWANAIQVQKVDSNPFQAMVDRAPVVVASRTDRKDIIPDEVFGAGSVEAPIGEAGTSDDLPF